MIKYSFLKSESQFNLNYNDKTMINNKIYYYEVKFS